MINIDTIHIAKKRKRCGDCEGCLSTDCGQCVYCCDKLKFGGTNLLKQSSIKRKCMQLKLCGQYFLVLFIKFLINNYVTFIDSQRWCCFNTSN